MGAIIVLDFFRHRERYTSEVTSCRIVNWGAVLGVAAGALVGNFVNLGISAINAMLVSIVCHIAVDGLIYARKG